MRFSVCLFAPAEDLIQGGVLGMDRHKEGRTDNLTGSCSSDDTTVAPHSDSRILKDRKEVDDDTVGFYCTREMSKGTVLLSEKEDPSRQLDSLFESPGNEPL